MPPGASRLPAQVRPRSYAIELDVALDQPEFEGRLDVALILLEPRARVIMHARDLDVGDASFRVEGRVVTARVDIDRDRETLTLIPKEALPPGEVELVLGFRGRVGRGLHGLYLVRDGDAIMLCSQCQPTGARRIFPCFDEPGFKASLRWTIRAPAGLAVLTNGPLCDVTPAGDGRAIWRFAPTAPMPSYLAALVVGDLVASETRWVGETPLRVFATRGREEQGRCALGWTEALLRHCEDYFGRPHPHQKHDQVAVPGFDAGGMENLGLVMFRQGLLLMREDATSWQQARTITRVVAHELAHTWFGNLVTMAWWDDLWLNEAFAEWFAHEAVAAVAPHYEPWSEFQQGKHAAMKEDARPTTHAIWSPVDTPAEALEMFDRITYQKGCAVIRMLERFAGSQPFRAGIRGYIEAFAHANATGDDLWRHLQGSTGAPVAAIMRSWIAQPGMPVVQIAWRPDVGLELAQRRFFSDPAEASEPCEQLWHIPMVLRFADDEGVREHRVVLDRRRATIDPQMLGVRGRLRWLLGNADDLGFYHVDASPGLQAALTAGGLRELSRVEQVALLNDRWALIRSGRGTTACFVELIDALADRPDQHVLQELASYLATLARLLEDSGEDAAREMLSRRIAARFGDQLDVLGDEPRADESPAQRRRRSLLLHLLASVARVPAVVARCVELAARERADASAVDPNIADTVVRVAAQCGDADAYEQWIATYRARRAAHAPPQQVLRYLYTLSEFHQAPLIERTLAQLDDGFVPLDSVGTMLSLMLRTRHARKQAWAHLVGRWASLRERVGELGLARLVHAIGGLSYERRGEIVAFFAENPPIGAEQALARAIESIDQRESLRRHVVPELLEVLLDQPLPRPRSRTAPAPRA